MPDNCVRGPPATARAWEFGREVDVESVQGQGAGAGQGLAPDSALAAGSTAEVPGLVS
jgi:hypothetical protein